MLDVREGVQPRSGLVYMYVAGSGGGTRYARLPPVNEIIPRTGYCLHAARLNGLTGILVARLPPVIKVIPRTGVCLFYVVEFF